MSQLQEMLEKHWNKTDEEARVEKDLLQTGLHSLSADPHLPTQKQNSMKLVIPLHFMS